MALRSLLLGTGLGRGLFALRIQFDQPQGIVRTRRYVSSLPARELGLRDASAPRDFRLGELRSQSLKDMGNLAHAPDYAHLHNKGNAILRYPFMHSCVMDGPTLFQNLLDLKQTNASNLADKLKNRSLQSGWNRFLQRKTAEPSRNTLQPAADYFGVSVEAFYSPEVAQKEWARITDKSSPEEVAAAPAPVIAPVGEGKSRRKPDASEFVEVRRAHVSFANGYGQVAYQEDDHPPLVFRSDFLRRLGIPPGKAVVVDAVGDSNEPKILDGSVVLLNAADTERLDGDFFAFRVDGNLLIKRLERIQGGAILAVAENSAFKPKVVVYNKAADFEVIGRARWTGAVL